MRIEDADAAIGVDHAEVAVRIDCERIRRTPSHTTAHHDVSAATATAIGLNRKVGRVEKIGDILSIQEIGLRGAVARIEDQHFTGINQQTASVAIQRTQVHPSAKLTDAQRFFR